MEQNLNQYSIFYAVAKAGKISAASEELFISQPAVSKAISKLEENLKTKLFLRNPRGVALTAEGLVLFEHLKTAFDSIEAGEGKIKKSNELGVGEIKIGASATLCKYILLPFLKKYIEKYPHIKITIETQSTYHTLKLLESGEIDIALVVKTNTDSKFAFRTIGHIEDVFVATKTYLDNLNVRELNGKPFRKKTDKDIFKNANIMLLDNANITRTYVDNYLRMNGIELNHVLEVNTMDLLIDFAKIGLGVACVIKDFVREDLEKEILTEIPLSKPINKRVVGFSYRKTPSREVEKFLEFIT